MRQLMGQHIVTRYWICAAALFSATSALGYSSNDIIATYAGNGTSGYSGDGGPAVSATLKTPSNIAVDGGGNLYISDPGSSVIRKVDTAGIITTFAGTGTPGYNGDNIPATMAQVSPNGLAFDSAGDLYLTDSNRIRKITMSTGIITTVAGTSASGCTNGTVDQAVFSAPLGLAFDTGGALYISEVGNKIVRKLSAGSVSTFAGACGSPVFNFPGELTTDGAGNVYVVDQGQTTNTANNQVWKYDSNGNRTLFAGSGAENNTGDGSLANSAGVTLCQPYGIARDAAGDIFISSCEDVRVVTPDGIIHTSTGNGTDGSTGDGSLATSGELKLAQGIAVNASGRLYVVDQLGYDVRIVGPAAPVEVTVQQAIFPGVDIVTSADSRINCPGTCGANYVAGMPVVLSDPTPIFDFLYEWSYPNCHGVTCTVFPSTSVPTSIEAFFTATYINTAFGGVVGPSLRQPFALAIDPHHNFYFSELETCTIRERTAAGLIITIAGNGICGNIGDGMQATQAELSNPQGVVIDSDGNVFIQDAGNSVVRKVTTDGVLHTFATGLYTGSNSPAIAVDAAGNLYMASSFSQIVRVEPNGMQQPFATIAGSAGMIQGLALDPHGGLVVYSSYGTTQYFTRVSAAGVSSPGMSYEYGRNGISGLAVDNNGILYSEDFSCSVNVTTSLFGTLPYFGGNICSDTGDGGLAVSGNINAPVGMAFDAKGFLYVVSSGGNSVRVIFPDAIFTGQFDF